MRHAQVSNSSGGNSLRTLVGSNLQTIQVSTTSGIHTIKVALPPGASPTHHFPKVSSLYPYHSSLVSNNNMPNLLPPSRRGSHVMSDNARAIIQHTPLSPYARLLIFRNLIFSSCALFTFYPNCIM